MKRILILGTARTGSTRLFHLVSEYYKQNGYPYTVVREFFNKRFFKEFKDRHEKFDYVMDPTNADKFMVMKCMFEQLWDFSAEQLSAFFNSFDDIIITHRENLYEQMLSFLIAHTMSVNGQDRWWKHNDGSEVYKPRIYAPLTNVHSFLSHQEKKRIIMPHMPSFAVNREYEEMSRLSPSELLKSVGIMCDDLVDQTVKFETLEEKEQIIINLPMIQQRFDELKDQQWEPKRDKDYKG